MPDPNDSLSELYHSTPSPRSPAALDETILKMAADHAPRANRRTPGWLPLASAASVVGLVSLLFHQMAGLPTSTDRAHAPTVIVQESQLQPAASRVDGFTGKVRAAPQAEPIEVSGALQSHNDEAMEPEAIITAADAVSKTLSAAPSAAQYQQPSIESQEPSARKIEERSAMEAVAPALKQQRAESRSHESLRATGELDMDATPADDAVNAEQWLENIKDLLTNGDKERAIIQLQHFRAAYPEHPIPDELTRLTDAPN